MENRINCDENCFLCEKKQVWKVNFAEFHGLCDFHKESVEESKNYRCIHCESTIFTCRFTSIQCDYCYENPKNHILGCDHKICEICFNEADSCCPLCVYNSSQTEIKPTLIDAQPQNNKITIEESSEDSYESSDSELAEEEEELYVIEEVEISLEASMIFDIRKSYQSTSVDSQSQTIKKIDIPAPQIPEQTFIYKKCPKCGNGILVEQDNYKDIYKCSSCDKFFCTSCLELLKNPSTQHPCTGSTKKITTIPRKKFNSQNKKLKKVGSMLQVCPYCISMREYRIDKGYYVCCENPNKCQLMFCLSCGASISEKNGEAFVMHYPNGSNNPCVDCEISKKYSNPIIYQYDRLKIYKS